jgi:hypothetical protein
VHCSLLDTAVSPFPWFWFLFLGSSTWVVAVPRSSSPSPTPHLAAGGWRRISPSCHRTGLHRVSSFWLWLHSPKSISSASELLRNGLSALSVSSHFFCQCIRLIQPRATTAPLFLGIWGLAVWWLSQAVFPAVASFRQKEAKCEGVTDITRKGRAEIQDGGRGTRRKAAEETTARDRL